ncbi:MAG TPA: hypothetical protein VKW76_13590 [Candidatus Binatia bacterium]|nr:hypothetical protein [Candidatus Binatia bacterium]
MTDATIACLSERMLLALAEGDGDREAQAHLRGCVLCAGRFRRLSGDIARIARVLREPPPRPLSHRAPRWLPAVAAVATAAALLGTLLLPRYGAPPAAGGRPATDPLPAEVLARGEAEPVALRRADNDLLAAALEEPFPCEWSEGGCDDDTDPAFGGE